jgi:tripartite-type tricarboxylate transporter receptor subunit TctC
LSATGPNSPTSVNPSALNALIGTKFKLISGYKSNAEMSAAMEKGETEGSFASWATLKTTFPHWLRDKKINPLVVYATERLKELPDAPTVTDLTDDTEQKQILSFIVSTGALGRSLLTAPGVGPGRVAELRAAFDAAMADPQLLADVARLNIEFGPLTGEAVANQLQDMFKAPQQVMARTKDIVLGAVRR